MIACLTINWCDKREQRQSDEVAFSLMKENDVIEFENDFFTVVSTRWRMFVHRGVTQLVRDIVLAECAPPTEVRG